MLLKVIRAANAGFCMGVSLALKKLENAIKNRSKSSFSRICTLGPIIHNPQVLLHFEELGVTCLQRPEMALPDDYILIRAHGIPLQVELNLRQNCSFVEDATCPKVKSAQLSIAQATAGGAKLLLFGEADHPEVRGLVSYAKGNANVIGSIEEIDNLRIDPTECFVLASQTTQDRDAFDNLAQKLSAKIPDLTILSTICNATKQRQEETLKIAAQADAMIIAGGKDSGNTRRLASLTAQAGIKAFHVETLEELNHDDFKSVKVVGLTAGASTPKSIIDSIEQWLLQINE